MYLHIQTCWTRRSLKIPNTTGFVTINHIYVSFNTVYHSDALCPKSECTVNLYFFWFETHHHSFSVNKIKPVLTKISYIFLKMFMESATSWTLDQATEQLNYYGMVFWQKYSINMYFCIALFCKVFAFAIIL